MHPKVNVKILNWKFIFKVKIKFTVGLNKKKINAVIIFINV